MRVVSNGAFVSDLQATIVGATNANPLVLTVNGTGAAAVSAVPINSGISQSYKPTDLVTLAGGIFSAPTVLSITNTLLLNLALNFSGVGVYAPADTIHLTGGTQSTPAVLTVTTTQVSGATIVSPGTVAPGTWSGTTTAIVQGTTGTGIKFQASCQMDVTGLLSVNSISLAGDYTVNPTTPAVEPVTLVSYSGGGAPVGVTLTGATLDITLGVLGFSISNAGVFTANPAGGTFTQASTSGSGTGATFLGALMAPHTVAVSVAGAYSVYPSNPVQQASTTGSGIGAQFTVTTTPISLVPFFNAGDWIEISGVGGMTQLNGLTAVIALVAGSSLTLNDVYGNPINSTAFGAYTSGGLASRIFTLSTIYAEADLDYLKFTQSADVMSICCVNQITQTEYPPQDLNRASDTSWTFTPTVPEPSVLPPTNAAGSPTTAGSTDYGYVVTAVSPTDGSESIASNIALISNAVDVASTAGTILITWTPPATPGVNEYNIYKAQPLPGPVPIPGGALYGFAGQAYGASWADNNIVADYAQVPPTHQDPFARGQIQSVKVLTSSGTITSVTFTFNTASGTDAVLIGIIDPNNNLVQVNVQDAGKNFEPGDTVNVIAVGGGSATALLVIGPTQGTYPSTVSYFQERRAYANTLNNPDTYYMSQPGAFTNFDSRIPTIDSDAIIGSPWSFEVNGIQWMVPTSGGLLVMTGLSAWLLVGTGSFATNVQEISPSSQNVTTQAFSGCSPTVPPIKINYDVIYVEAQGSYYRDLPYQLYALSEPIDITENSSHLFKNYTILQHAWCEQPYKLLWAIRSDGVMLSLTYYKSQQIAGWARHDTNGLFVSNCSVVEPPNNALYVATQRFPGTNIAYMIERMDNRQWLAAENVWAVDAGLSLAQPTPNASLTASSATGLGACTGVTSIATNSGWSAATTASVIDAPLIPNGPPGPGVGAVPTLTIVGGVITAITFSGGNQGTGYLNPQLVFNDPAGSQGGSFASAPNAIITLNNAATFTASAAVFSGPNVGSVIRMGGGIAAITAFTDTEHVTANILSPIIDVVPNSGGIVESQAAGSWTMTAPVSTIGGLQHLAGATVTGLADGNVIPKTVVSATGTITLATPASQVVVGLAFLPQFQTVYLDAGEPTMQGQRKKIPAVTVRLEASRGMRMGTNQPDASTRSPMPVSVPWNEGAGGLMGVIYTNPPNYPLRPYNSLCPSLVTGDIRIPVGGGIATTGQVALQQDNPLPLNVLALYVEVLPGDTAQTQWPKKQGK